MEVVRELASELRVCRQAADASQDPVRQLQVLEDSVTASELSAKVLSQLTVDRLHRDLSRRLQETAATDLHRRIHLSMELLALAIVQHDLRAACGWYEAIAALHALAGRSADSTAGLVRRSAVARVLGDTELYADACIAAGQAYRQLGTPEVAIAYLRYAAGQALSHEHWRAASRAYGELGEVYHRLGLPGPALAARRQQLRLAEAAAGPLGERCDALAGAGEAALAGRDLPAAADCFERELRASREADDPALRVRSHLHCGQSCLALRHLKEAFQHFEDAVRFSEASGNRRDLLAALEATGDAYRQELEDEKAAEHYRRLRAVAEAAGEVDLYFHVSTKLAECLLETEAEAEAEEVLLDSLQRVAQIPVHVERQRTEAVFAPPYRCYELLEHLLVRARRERDALAFSDAGRARTLLRCISQKCKMEEKRHFWQDDPRNVDRYLADVQRTARDTAATLVVYSLNGYSGRLHTWIVRPDTSAIHFAQLPWEGEASAGLADLKALLHVVEDGPGRAEAAEDSPEAVQRVTLEDVQRVERRVASAPPNKTLRFEEDPARWQAALAALHRALVAPIQQYLPAQSVGALLGIVPCTALWYVPWNALYAAADRRYLVQEYCVFVSPSVATLDLLADRHFQLQHRAMLDRFRAPASPADGGGGDAEDPDSPSGPRPTTPSDAPLVMGSGGLARPSVILEDEAKHVGALVEAPPILAAGATAQRLLARLPSARLVHLSVFCHTEAQLGLVQTSLTSSGFLQLSPGSAAAEAGNHFLSTAELGGLELRTAAQLVTLPHCDVARRTVGPPRGRDPPEGPAALLQCWLGLAVPCVVLTLWDSPTLSAVPLIRPFYSALGRGVECTFTPRGNMKHPPRVLPVSCALRADSFSLSPLPQTHLSRLQKGFPVISDTDATDLVQSATADAVPEPRRRQPTTTTADQPMSTPSHSATAPAPERQASKVPALQEPPRPAHTTPAPRPPLAVEVPSPDQALKVPQAFSPGRPSPPSPLKKILKLSVVEPAGSRAAERPPPSPKEAPPAEEPTTPTGYLPPTPLRPRSALPLEEEARGEAGGFPTQPSVHFCEAVDDPEDDSLPSDATPWGERGRAPAAKARCLRYAVLQNVHQHHDRPWLWAAWLCVGCPF